MPPHNAAADTAHLRNASVATSAAAHLSADFAPPAGLAVRPPTLMLRMRAPEPAMALHAASVDPGDDCVVVEVQTARELLVVRPKALPTATAIRQCTVLAQFVATTSDLPS